jgi:hypothetical protein
MSDDSVPLKTETVLVTLAGLAAVAAFRRFALLRFAAPWIVRGIFNRVRMQTLQPVKH